jgi:acyl carrier protein
MWNDQFEVLLRSHLPFLSAAEELRPELDLREFGLDSMGVVDLLVSLESEFRVRMTDDLLSMDTFATPGVLWAALDEIQKVRPADPNWNG